MNMERFKGIPIRKTKEGLLLSVRVEPRSSKAMVVGPYGDTLKVKLTAPPVDDRANKQLLEVLARHFGVKKTDVSIIKGQHSKNKTVLIKPME